MRAAVSICAAVVLPLATGCIGAPSKSESGPLRASDLPGSYELVDRVLASGTILQRPEIAGLYTWGHGRANFNLFLHNPDGTLASESSIIRYTLSDKEYCEWIEYTTRNNLDAPGLTNEVPVVSSHCAPIRTEDNKVIFSPPGESVMTIYERNGFTAIIHGQFTDHWRKIE